MQKAEVSMKVPGMAHGVRAKVYMDGRRIIIDSGFNKKLLEEIKKLDGRVYHGRPDAPLQKYIQETCGHTKIWSAKDTPRNRFHLAYLIVGMDPYAPYTKPLELIESPRFKQLLKHQILMASHILMRRHCIIDGDMGVGKTLAEFEAREQAGIPNAWFVGPLGAIRSIEQEVKKWLPEHPPKLMTYDRLRIDWEAGKFADNWVPPQWVTFDEASRLKNPNAKRTRAAMWLADTMRQHWNRDCYINLMTGSITPNEPTDQWALAEIACPGFLAESSVAKLKQRLAVLRKIDYGHGPTLEVERWRDRDGLCKKCGKEKSEHSIKDDHPFIPGINEVAALAKRMEQGLVLRVRKKDVLDLPDKWYTDASVEPKPRTLQLARALVSTAPNASKALSDLRTFSDGFVYNEEVVGKKQCFMCNGTKQCEDWVAKTPDVPPLDEDCDMCLDKWRETYFVKATIPCHYCNETGETDDVKRTAEYVGSPKEDMFKDDLDELSDIGRFVIYAAFTGSIDRLVELATKEKWEWVRVDGRGWHSSLDCSDLLDAFQNRKDIKKLVFIGHPGAAGMGLTLTASPRLAYYSNTFNAEDRIQSEDRIHRIGMDVQRGATIKDYYHLNTDRLIHAKLKEKIARQDMSQGLDVDMKEILEALGDQKSWRSL